MHSSYAEYVICILERVCTLARVGGILHNMDGYIASESTVCILLDSSW